MTELLASIRATDAAIAQTPGGGLTLDPGRPSQRATTLEALAAWARPRLADSGPVFEGYVAGLHSIARAQLEAFPGNIFWDFDRLAAVLAREAVEAPEGFSHRAARLADVMTLFGGQSPIRFQYVHDFMYGFDWSAWVGRDPEGRASVDPFDSIYVERTHKRGRELLALIDQGDDEEYPPVGSGEFRNPFGFDRTPDDERRLFEALAAADGIPNPAWRIDGTPTWDRDFYALRERVSRMLVGDETPDLMPTR